MRIPHDRICVPWSDWPARIRDAFDQVFHAGERPRRRSAGGQLPGARSIRNYEEAVGDLVGHLRRFGLERSDAELIDYLDDNCRESFLQAMLARGLSDYTIFGCFEKLRIVAGWLYPDRTLPAILRLHCVPIKRLLAMKRRDVRPPSREALIAWCQDLFAEALTFTEKLPRRFQIRDAAMFAVLTSLGPRRRSIQLMQIGIHLRQRPSDGSWWLDFAPDDVKQCADYENQLDPWTWPILERYLATERVELLGNRHEIALWIGWRGRQLGASAIWRNVHVKSLQRFGHAYSVHMFRYSIATAGMCDGETGFREACERLGHRSADMTLRYVHDSVITEVSRRHSKVMDAISGKDRLTLERVFPEETAPPRANPYCKRPQRRLARRQLDMFALLETVDAVPPALAPADPVQMATVWV
jgi:hypothetical protein